MQIVSPKYFHNCVQVGVIVKDLEQTMQNLAEIFGIGPFRVVEWPPAERADIEEFYYGKPINSTARKAFAGLGQVELELIQPLAGESIWTDFLEAHGEGIHHIRFNVPDEKPVIEYLAAKGIEASQMGSGVRPGTFWVNFDTESKIGFTIEIMKALPGASGVTFQIEGDN